MLALFTGMAIAIFILIAMAGLIWIYLPGWLTKRFGELQSGNSYREALPKVVGFPIILIGGAGAVLTTIQALDSFSRGQEITFQEQYRRGFEALGNDNIATRIGGIYTLESLLEQSSESVSAESKTSSVVIILRALAAFAVESSQRSKTLAAAMPKDVLTSIVDKIIALGRDEDQNSERSVEIIPADALTALVVIGTGIKNLEDSDKSDELEPRLDLSGGSFVGSRIVRTDLSHVDLRDADLRGSDFFRTKFYASNLRFTKLQGINGVGADFSHAGLSYASFAMGINWATPNLQTGSAISSQLSDSTYYNASGNSVDFSGSCLASAIFNNARLGGAIFDKANLYKARFHGAQLSRIPERVTSFVGTKLLNADFSPDAGSTAVIDGASFTNADLRNVNFSGAVLKNIDFRRANLIGAVFSGATLSSVSFQDALLGDARFDSVAVSSVSFDGAWVRGAVFSHATQEGLEMNSLCGQPLSPLGVSSDYCGTPPKAPPPLNPQFTENCRYD